MKTGLSPGAFGRELCRIGAERKDRIIDMHQIEYANGALFNSKAQSIHERERFELTEHSSNQVAQYLNIPTAAMAKFGKDAGHTYHWNGVVNEQIKRKPGPRLLRVLDGKLQGFVSTRFNIGYDAHRTFPPLMETLFLAGMKIESAQVTQTHSYIKAVSPKVQGAVLHQPVNFGLCLSTSDVGLARHRASLLVYTLECLNGMVIASVDCSLEHTHRGRNMWSNDEGGLDGEPDPEKITQAITTMGVDMVKLLDERKIGTIIDQINNVAEMRIPRDEKQVEKALRKSGISPFGETESVLKHLARENRYTLWGLSSAITRAAQDVESYDRSTQMEAIGWKVLQNPPSFTVDTEPAVDVVGPLN